MDCSWGQAILKCTFCTLSGCWAPPVLRVERADLAPHVAAVRERGRDGPSVDGRDDAEGPGPVGGDDVAAQRGAGGVGALEAPGRRRRGALEREGGGPRGLDELFTHDPRIGYFCFGMC